MRRDLRLRRNKEFQNVFNEGRGWANRLLVLKAVHNGCTNTRVGLITSRRIGNAVVRNKARRRLREILKSIHIEDGWDLVLIVRKNRLTSEYNQLKLAAQDLLSRSNLIERALFTGSGNI
jgi:ribonuclease P protein component